MRGLLISPEPRILLIRIVLSDRAFWITPGGGMDDGEDPRTALERELREETGRGRWELGPEVWERHHRFDVEGDRVTQHERFFLVPTEWFEPPAIMPDPIERRMVEGFRWWGIDAIDASDEDFAPSRLGPQLRGLLRGDIPEVPIDVGV